MLEYSARFLGMPMSRQSCGLYLTEAGGGLSQVATHISELYVDAASLGMVRAVPEQNSRGICRMRKYKRRPLVSSAAIPDENNCSHHVTVTVPSNRYDESVIEDDPPASLMLYINQWPKQ